MKLMTILSESDRSTRTMTGGPATGASRKISSGLRFLILFMLFVPIVLVSFTGPRPDLLTGLCLSAAVGLLWFAVGRLFGTVRQLQHLETKVETLEARIRRSSHSWPNIRIESVRNRERS